MLLGRREGLPLLYVHKFGQGFSLPGEPRHDGDGLRRLLPPLGHAGPELLRRRPAAMESRAGRGRSRRRLCRSGFGPAAKSVRQYYDRLETLINEVATKKLKHTEAFQPEALAGLRKELEQARKDVASDMTITRRIAFLELGLRWTELEARAHAFLADPKADKAAARKTLDDRFALMREIFQRTPLALNVAYISWGEDALWHGSAGSRRRGRKMLMIIGMNDCVRLFGEFNSGRLQPLEGPNHEPWCHVCFARCRRCCG